MADYFWTKDKSKFVSLDKIRNFEVKFQMSGTSVIAWFSDIETLEIGVFAEKAEAKFFLENLEIFIIPKEK